MLSCRTFSNEVLLSENLHSAGLRNYRRFIVPSPQITNTNPFFHPDDIQHDQNDQQIQTLTGSSSKAAEAEKSKGPEVPKEAPPPYEGRKDEIYQGDGKYITKDGKNRLMASPTHRNELIHKERINTKYIHSEEVGVAYDKMPVFAIDGSISMGNKISKGSSGVRSRIKNAFTMNQTALKEQKGTVVNLLGDLESYCARIPCMFNLNGGFVEKASSTGVDTLELLSRLGGGTPLAATLRTIRAHLEAQTDTSDITLYVFTDGLPADVGSIYHVDWVASKLAFENELRSLTDNGINVRKPDGTVHNRKVGIAMQYVGDKDKPYDYNFSRVETKVKDYLHSNTRKGSEPVSSEVIEKKIYEEMMSQVRGAGEDYTGAYYSALDNEKMGGIKRFDVNDDKHSEINDAKKHGHTITSKEVGLKMMVGPWVPRLDGKDEGDLKLEKQVAVLLDRMNDFAHQLATGR